MTIVPITYRAHAFWLNLAYQRYSKLGLAHDYSGFLSASGCGFILVTSGTNTEKLMTNGPLVELQKVASTTVLGPIPKAFASQNNLVNGGILSAERSGASIIFEPNSI